MYLLGIDVGTSNCKATVVDTRGRVMGKAGREYFTVQPKPGWQEVDPRIVWDAVRAVVREAVNGCEKPEPIAGVSVSSFGETAVPVGRDGQPLGNGILYIDPRGQEEAALLHDGYGEERLNAVTGASAHSMYTLPKLMWLKQHRPEVYEKTWKFMLFADYVLFRLGAEPHTDYTLATRNAAFDIVNKRWDEGLLGFAGIDPDKFCTPVQSGTNVGRINPDVARELGVSPDAILAAGGHDQPCAALGAGAIRPGLAIDGLGTTECLCPAFASPSFGSAMLRHGFSCVPHTVPKLYATIAFTFTSGSVLKWFRDNVGRQYRAEAQAAGMNVYDYIIEQASPEACPVFVLPHFAGAATPYMDNDALGAVLGLTINTTDRDIAKGILEGITFEMVRNTDALSEAGIEISELRAVGGLAKSDPFLQLKASIMGRRIVTLEISEAGTLGVAMLAGAASGIYAGLDDAAAQLVRVKRVFEPDEQLHAVYAEKYETYKRLYPAVTGVFRP